MDKYKKYEFKARGVVVTSASEVEYVLGWHIFMEHRWNSGKCIEDKDSVLESVISIINDRGYNTISLTDNVLHNLVSDSYTACITFEEFKEKVEASRVLEVPLELAKKWYKSDDNSLKELALQVYSEKELMDEPFTYEEIMNIQTSRNSSLYYVDAVTSPYITDKIGTSVNKSWCNNPFVATDSNTIKRAAIAIMLRNIADYYNDSWKKDFENTGYFISLKQVIDCGLRPQICVFKHISVKYPVVYFKNKEDAEKAIKMFSEEELKWYLDYGL